MAAGITCREPPGDSAHMEQETILYYYPVKEKTGQDLPVAKRHWWQEAELMSFRVAQRIYACPVPVYYYKRNPWKPQTLCKAMETALYQMEGMTDTVLAAGMEKLLTEEMLGRWHPRLETLKSLTALLLAQKAENQGVCPQKAVVKLGDIQDADWQMEMTWELLQPYLPKINQCIIRCDAAPGIDVREELGSFLEDYYYEYGLVVQTESRVTGKGASQAVCEREEKDCLYLDFRKDNLYRSIRKYLDTMLKNRYY